MVIELLLTLTLLLILSAIRILYGKRIAANAKIPMQWGFGGEPTWKASRNLGLWFTPVLAMLIFGALLIAVFSDGGGEAGSAVWLVLLFDLLFVFAHAMHLAFATQSIAREHQKKSLTGIGA